MKYKIYNDDNDGKYASIISFDDSIIDAIIPESISFESQIIPVKKIDEDAFKNNSKIRSITIPSSVTTIGSSAFSGCSNLITVTISENSQLTSIGSSAFNGCSSLTSIYIPDSVTTIGSGAFYSCSNLTTATISENSQLTSIGNEAFSCCSSLTSIYIPDSVTTIGVSAFDGCSSLTSIYIPDSVTSIGCRAFRYSSNLTIYCEASSEPSGWDSSWNFYCPVVWSSNGEHGEYNGFTYGVSIDSEGNPYITITGYDGFNFDLVIPEYIEVNGEQIVVKEISNTAFGYYGITSINIPDGVTSIGYCAFYNCSNLKTVSISKSSQLTTIGRKAFNGCSSLTSIYIPSSVATIKYGAFENCSSLTSIYIPSSVATIEYGAFENCSSLIICCEVPSTPNGWDSSWNYPCPVVWSSNGQYREYSGFIYGVCTDSEGNPYITIAGYTGSSTNVVIPLSINVDGEDIPIKAIAINAFRNNDAITSVTIPNSVTIIGNSAFRDCPYLTIYCEASSEPSGWDSSWNWGCPVVRSSYLGMHGYFDDFEYGVCIDEDGNKYVTITGYDASDTDVVIPESINVNGENIIVKTIADNAFRNNDAIASVTISDSVTSIGYRAFDGCSSLTSIYIPNSVTTIGSYAFEDCSNLTIYCQACSKPSGWAYDWCDEFSDDRPVVWSSYLGMHGYFDDFEYGVCIDEDGNKYIAITGYNASNTDVVIPESINVNGENIIVKAIADNAFDRSSLTSIYIPDSVTTIGYSAFYSCSNLTTATISESSQLTTIGESAFYNCSSLTSIYIPDSVTAIGSRAFYECSSLTSIYIPDSVTTIGSGVFFNCSSLTSIYIPEGVTTIGSDTFCRCSNLATVTISESSQLTTIGSSAFAGCSSLTSIYIPDSVTTIGSDAFRRCSNLATVTISESSQLTTIGSFAFSGCSNLMTVTISENSQLTSIGSFAFDGCSSLTSIYIPNSVTTIGLDAFEDCSSLTIYCEESCQPNGWNSNWNPSNRPVVWETTYEEYLGGDCGQKTGPF